LLQAADIVLGAIVSDAAATHKVELSRYIQDKLKVGGGYKLVRREWSPTLRR